MRKYNLTFGKEFESCKISFPQTVPVTMNFDNSKVLGFANLREEKGEIVAEMNINVPNENLLSCTCGGMITSREGSLITGFCIDNVSFVPKGLVPDSKI